MDNLQNSDYQCNSLIEEQITGKRLSVNWLILGYMITSPIKMIQKKYVKRSYIVSIKSFVVTNAALHNTDYRNQYN